MWPAELARRSARSAALICALSAIVACHSSAVDPNKFTVSGTVSGLASGSSMLLSDNGGSTLTVSSNGSFTFASGITAGGSYDVTVTTQPNGQGCAVTNASGSDLRANVSNVSVVCSTQSFTIGGSISGLPSGTQIVLQNNGADSLTLSANGTFTFATGIAFDGSYVVTIATQPTGTTCSVSNGSGPAITANVANVSVTCATETFTVGGTLSGLAGGGQVSLEDNGGDPLAVPSNGRFTFNTPVPYGGSYAVTVGTQPAGQVCTVNSGSGNNVATNVTGVSVSCSAATVTVGGTLSGLASGTQLTLYNNGADPLTLTANGAFRFSTPIASQSSYAVTVATQPNGQSCVVGSGSGTNVTINVTDVSVNCYQTSFTTAGSYTWTVPSDVSQIQIVATGGGGGGGGLSGTSPGAPGGAGGVVTSTLSVTAGEVVNIVIGGGGNPGSTQTAGTFGPAGGGGGSTNVTASAVLIIAGGGGGGGGSGWAGNATPGGSGGGSGGDGDSGGTGSDGTGGVGGSSGVGGAGGQFDLGGFPAYGATGGSGSGGSGGTGGSNGLPGGNGGASSGTGTGGDGTNFRGGGGGGGYGGGGSGYNGTGGGAGGSTGPTGSTYVAGSNGGASGTQGTDGSVVITIQ